MREITTEDDLSHRLLNPPPLDKMRLRKETHYIQLAEDTPNSTSEWSNKDLFSHEWRYIHVYIPPCSDVHDIS